MVMITNYKEYKKALNKILSMGSNTETQRESKLRAMHAFVHENATDNYVNSWSVQENWFTDVAENYTDYKTMSDSFMRFANSKLEEWKAKS